MKSIVEPNDPTGMLVLQTIAMPKETNINGDIFGGWLMSQMDLAGGIFAGKVVGGRLATVAVSSMVFINPVPVGAMLSCYASLVKIGTTSITMRIAAWSTAVGERTPCKVTEGEFVFVAIDDDGKKRRIDKTTLWLDGIEVEGGKHPIA